MHHIPLGQEADWVVMAAWLVQLRALLLLPADAPVQQEAAAEVEQLRTRLARCKPCGRGRLAGAAATARVRRIRPVRLRGTEK